MNPRVTVIVLTYNNLDDTIECLDSVSRIDYPSLTVVLVDNHSTDGSIEKIKALFPDIHYVENARNLGVAGGRNAGWQYARKHFAADYLFFLDNDTIVMPDTLSHLSACLVAHSDVVMACGKTYTAPPSTTIMSVGMSVNLYTGLITDIGTGVTDVGQYETPGYVAACGGFAFLVRDSAFFECNGLDEDFNPYGFEDVDFNLRSLEKGGRCYYVPEAIIHHKGCKIGRGYVPLYEKHKAMNYFRLLGRHTTLVQKLCCSVCVPARTLVAMLRYVVRGEIRVVGYQLRGLMESVFKPGPKAE
jgi:GT2 family glycosyltransferase